jgi:hypothetical protein
MLLKAFHYTCGKTLAWLHHFTKRGGLAHRTSLTPPYFIDLQDNRITRSKFSSSWSCTIRGKKSKRFIGGRWTICDCNNSHGLRTGILNMTFKDIPHVHIKELVKKERINFKHLFIIKFIITCNISFYLKFIISSLLLLSRILEKKLKSN